MKLLFCIRCGDVFNLTAANKKCSCGSTQGKYLSLLQAEYSGEFAIPVGFSNEDFIYSVVNQPTSGAGKVFTAFVIPKDCSTFVKRDS